MRVLCRHGHFAFFPRDPDEVGRFMRNFKTELVRCDDFYTFPLLSELEDYSLIGKTYGNLPALTTFAGKPWEILKANGFVYSLVLGLLVPAESIGILVDPPIVDFYFLSETPLLQAGSINRASQRILSYEGEFNFRNSQLKISELSYE